MMKKVVHVLYSMDMGGIETFLINLLKQNYLSSQGVQMDFLVWKKENKLSEEIKKYNGQILVVNHPKKNFFIFSKQVYAIFQKYDVVHLHSDFFNGYLAFLAKIANVKVIVSHSHTINDGKESNLYRKIYRKLSRYLILKNAHFLLGCSTMANQHLYGDCNPAEVIFNGIHVHDFCKNKNNNFLREELKIDKNDLILGHIGRFSYEKNHKRLIDIFSELKKLKPNIHLVLVGEGDLKEDILNYVKKKGLEKDVHFLGSRRDIANIMNSLDLFILPSLFEGMPLTVIEAQTAGVKTIISENVPDDVIVINDLVLKVDLDKSDTEIAQEVLNMLLSKKYTINDDHKKKIEKFDISNIYEYLINHIYKVV